MEIVMKVQSFLLSAVLVVGSSVVQAEDTQLAQVSFKDTVINQATSLVENTVNLITTPFLSDKDVECLARNIFYESGGEPEEGKVAVGLVTINRSQDPRYPNTVCGVVKQKTTFTVPKEVTTVKTVKTGWSSKQITETTTIQTSRVVCQFSWNCMRVPKIKQDDPRWIESQRIAQELSQGGYQDYRQKYENAYHFHAVYVKPGWKLDRIGRVGNHIFYGPVKPK